MNHVPTVLEVFDALMRSSNECEFLQVAMYAQPGLNNTKISAGWLIIHDKDRLVKDWIKNNVHWLLPYVSVSEISPLPKVSTLPNKLAYIYISDISKIMVSTDDDLYRAISNRDKADICN